MRQKFVSKIYDIDSHVRSISFTFFMIIEMNEPTQLNRVNIFTHHLTRIPLKITCENQPCPPSKFNKTVKSITIHKKKKKNV